MKSMFHMCGFCKHRGKDLNIRQEDGAVLSFECKLRKLHANIFSHCNQQEPSMQRIKEFFKTRKEKDADEWKENVIDQLFPKQILSQGDLFTDRPVYLGQVLSPDP